MWDPEWIDVDVVEESKIGQVWTGPALGGGQMKYHPKVGVSPFSKNL
jgi:hypothetical protein